MKEEGYRMPSSRELARSWAYPRQKPFEGTLRKAAAAWFAKRGLTTHTQMPYCLDAHENWADNVILNEVASLIRTEQEMRLGVDAFPLHKYLHHGLSSQAMLFNLVGPLLVRKDLDPLRVACEAAGIPWPQGRITHHLEAEDRAVFNEDTGQPTSLDLAITGEQGAPLYFEAKLVEKEFGGCSVFAQGDCDGQNPVRDLSSCYLHHVGRLYWTQMADQGVLDSPIATGCICPFASYYQFFREMLFAAEKGGHLVLLYDARNPVFVREGTSGRPTRGLWPFLVTTIPSRLHTRLHTLTLQDVVRALEDSRRHGDWIATFKGKYGLVPEAGS